MVVFCLFIFLVWLFELISCPTEPESLDASCCVHRVNQFHREMKQNLVNFIYIYSAENILFINCVCEMYVSDARNLEQLAEKWISIIQTT